VDTLFSDTLKEVISKSRDIAIDLGYDYISTIHFYLADCEIPSSTSLLKLGFTDQTEYIKFKENYRIKTEDLLNYIDESLPLTTEAEKTIRAAVIERKIYKQTQVSTCYLFIAALKTNSLLSECFKHTPNILDTFIEYYKESGAFENGKISDKNLTPFNRFLTNIFGRSK
jgi:ATP-dependent Clp protease ATP-binding subunit ClpC